MVNKVRVKNMCGNHGPVKNQFLIYTDDGVYFQSYSTIVAFKPYDSTRKIQLDSAWDYSRTTSKYLRIFLGETKPETARKIVLGEYELINLNC